MATTARHHLVPQFLLRRFANEDGKLVMVKRDDPSVALLTTVNNACNEAGFYRIETDDLEPQARDGHDPELVEKLLAVYEGRAEASIRNVSTAQPPWSPADRYNLAMFVAFQYVRGWRFRRQIDDLGTLAMRREMLAQPDTIRESARRFLRARGDAAAPAEVEAFVESAYGRNGPRLVMHPAHAIQAALGFAVRQLAPELFDRRIRFLTFGSDSTLLISDSPVVTWAPGRLGDRVVSLDDAASIILPLSPTTALSFVRGGSDAVSVVGRVRADQINTAVADIAHRWIYHHPASRPLEGLVVPTDKPQWVDEKLAGRIDDDGNYREMWQTVQR